MKTENRRNLCLALCLLGTFLLWTLAIRRIDVQAVGPGGSAVGFASLNRFIHTLTGVHMPLYTITDRLSLVPLMTAAGFGVLGLLQWIRRKHILLVDYSLLVLGGFYLVVIAAYVLFEQIAVNYRPVWINGCLEVSYPSSTTMLVLCVMPTAVMQFNARIRNKVLKRCTASAITAFAVFMVLGRLFSDVHWFTDIVGSVFLSAGLVLLYRTVSRMKVSQMAVCR